jgi:putative inorganic carbon (hco3(-)) transporter
VGRLTAAIPSTAESVPAPQPPALQIWLVGAAAALAAAASALVIYGSDAPSAKVLAVLLGVLLFGAGAYLSSNVRLFTLWCLMLTLPFDLSKRFGPVIAKMGGETAFRLEMSDPFLLVLALFLIRDLWTGRVPGLRIPKVTYIWLTIAAIGCGWVLFGTWRMTAAHEVVRMLKLTLLFLVMCNELQRPQRVLHCAAALALAVLLQSGVGLLQYVTRAHLGLELLGETGAGTLDQLAADSVKMEKAFRAGAFLSHPNLFGIFLATLLPLSIAGFLLRAKAWFRILFLASTTLGTAALVATLSRSGWVSFAAAFTLLMTLLVLHESSRRKSLLALLGALLALSAVAVVFSGPILTRITGSKQSAMLSRAEYIRDASGMIRQKPLLGWGLNSYVYAAPPFTQYGARGAREKYKNWLPPVHNIYLLWWTETGLVGLLIHLAMLFVVVRIAVGNLKVQDDRLFALNAACLSAMLALLVDGFFSFSLRFNSILRVFWVLAAMIMAIHYLRRQPAVAAEA